MKYSVASGDGITRTAVISDDGLYRYSLGRSWAADVIRVCLFVMLNPSTADALRDDPTVTRCIRFAQAWGFDALTIVNLYAYRARDPRELRSVMDPVGDANNAFIYEATCRSEMVVAAWGGSLPAGAGPRVDRVMKIIDTETSELFHLGLTAGGQPRHPLMLQKDTALQKWERAA